MRCPHCGACPECGHVVPGVNPFPMRPVYPGTYPGPLPTTTYPQWTTSQPVWIASTAGATWSVVH